MVVVEAIGDDFEPFSKPCYACGETIGYNGKEVCKVSLNREHLYKNIILDF